MSELKDVVNTLLKQSQVDEHAETELLIYIENDSDLYNQKFIPMVRNLVNKMANGIYDHQKAAKLFEYLALAGAKKYTKEFSIGESDYKNIFNPATRRQVAKDLADEFYAEAILGKYDRYLNKKNLKKVKTLKGFK